MAALPGKVLMGVDAVGGVWRYAMELAAGLRAHGIDIAFIGFGPGLSSAQAREAHRLGECIWSDQPLDWTVDDPAALSGIADAIADAARSRGADLVHLNLPSQAAGLAPGMPVVVAAHSCVVTWFRAVRGTDLPDHWAWQHDLNRRGLDEADLVLTPSRSHADLMQACYGPVERLAVIPNAIAADMPDRAREDFVFAAARWWDDGKNGAMLDEAARRITWPVILAGPLTGPNGQSLTVRHAWSVGEMSSNGVRALMRRAPLVVSPSLYEPFGLAVLEAACAEAALVLADIPTYREFWDEAALFADPRDANAFGEAVERLIRDAGERARLAGLAKARSAQFQPAAQARAVIAAYRMAMGRRRQSTRAA